jgi:nicotinate-nucleotide pyrophosphorylase (carboxylating)
MVSIDFLLNFIREDAPFGDITSETIIPDTVCDAWISAEQPAVIAGLSEASVLFRYFEVDVDQQVSDGSPVRRGDILLTLHGPAKKILLVERTALNIIGRMSGIATATRESVEQVHRVNPSCRVAATRKTCPGFRYLDKKAVSLGGGDTHRSNLSDGILIKDNHLAIVNLTEAIALAKSRSPWYKIEVEVETPNDAVLAAQSGSDIIMFDNMTPGQVEESLDALVKKGLRDNVIIEISGGIDAGNIVEYAALGVDVISIGSLTHSVKNMQVHLEIMPLKK